MLRERTEREIGDETVGAIHYRENGETLADRDGHRGSSAHWQRSRTAETETKAPPARAGRDPPHGGVDTGHTVGGGRRGRARPVRRRRRSMR